MRHLLCLSQLLQCLFATRHLLHDIVQLLFEDPQLFLVQTAAGAALCVWQTNWQTRFHHRGALHERPAGRLLQGVHTNCDMQLQPQLVQQLQKSTILSASHRCYTRKWQQGYRMPTYMSLADVSGPERSENHLRTTH